MVGGWGGSGGAGRRQKRATACGKKSLAETARALPRTGSRHIHKHRTLQSKPQLQTMQNITFFFFFTPDAELLTHTHPPVPTWYPRSVTRGVATDHGCMKNILFSSPPRPPAPKKKGARERERVTLARIPACLSKPNRGPVHVLLN